MSLPAKRPPRLVLEAVLPCIDGGRFPAKRVVGESVAVEAHVLCDGHDTLAVRLHHRFVPAKGEGPWRQAPMRPLGNDRWTASFDVERLGRYEYRVEAWVDEFCTWRDALAKKVAADLDVSAELEEGAALVRAAGRRAARQGASRRRRPAASGAARASDPAAWLRRQAEIIGGGGSARKPVRAALSTALEELVSEYAPRPDQVSSQAPLEVVVEPERARAGAWYEMFPRSAGPDPTRSATFAEAAERLADIAAMGFEVLYLPPIHPIGLSFRKGRNNTLTPAPGDPGSPWAIGGAAGGHKSVEPGLGTLKDFDRFVAAARRHRLEIALDIAFQASPDHPYVAEHPEWFRHRLDGSIMYAENPPKKYQDIYPFNFESARWQELWRELESVFAFWIAHGVSIFRVDNPHTKPFAFWEWVIGEVRRKHPQAVFLSEAFTRPKIMRQLAKRGFSQSYSYFTWRNTKAELTEYLTELMQTPVREYLRPNFFANTPDILHAFLQDGGRPAFQIRFVLAATLASNYGIYSGFELCDNEAVAGTEEYLNSEKYQFRHRDWDAPGNIKDLIARVNRLRRGHPALLEDWSLRFHPTDNDYLLCYSKASPDLSDVVVGVVNLDPHRMQHGWVVLPIDQWDLDPAVPYTMHELLNDVRYEWRGARNYVRLDPTTSVAHLLHLTR